VGKEDRKKTLNKLVYVDFGCSKKYMQCFHDMCLISTTLMMTGSVLLPSALQEASGIFGVVDQLSAPI
jgi:hypothetical protein